MDHFQAPDKQFSQSVKPREPPWRERATPSPPPITASEALQRSRSERRRHHVRLG